MESATENCEESQGPITCLPDDILMLIFAHLDKRGKAGVAGVCQRWRDVVYDPSLWRTAWPRLDLHTASPHVFPSLQRRRLRRVVVTRCYSREAMTSLLSGLPDLHSLDLGQCLLGCSTSFMEAVSVQSSNLTTLTLEAPLSKFDAVLEHLPNLEDLTLRGSIEKKFCLNHGFHLRRMRRLSMSGKELTDRDIADLAGTTSPHDLSVEDFRLEELIISYAEELTDISLECLCKSFPRMTSLRLDCWLGLEGHSLEYLPLMPQLQTLNLKEDPLTALNTSHLGVCSTSVTSLNLASSRIMRREGITQEGIVSLARCFPSLKVLNLRGLVVSEGSLLTLAEKLPQIESIHVSAVFPRTVALLKKMNRGYLLK